MIVAEPLPGRIPVRKTPIRKSSSFLLKRPERKASKAMTVCVAALCEDGKKVVVATDCRLSYGGIASDALAGKLYWFGDWMFLYAGNPSHVELINEELRQGPPLERKTIYEMVLTAYRKAEAKFCAHIVLSPFDLTMEEFKTSGKKMFGERLFGQMTQQINQEAVGFNEHLLVVGWGDNENAANIFQIGPTSLDSHALTGSAAIGSGAEVALSNLLLLGQARYSSLGNTLYAVAAAKFSAEMSQDSDVGANTMMYVTWKRTDKDEKGKRSGQFLNSIEIDQLREVWEQHGKPKIPRQSAATLWPIVSRIRAAKPEPHMTNDMVLRLSAEAMRQRKEEEDADGGSMPAFQQGPDDL